MHSPRPRPLRQQVLRLAGLGHGRANRIEDPIQASAAVEIRHQFLPDGSFLVLGPVQELCVPSLKKPAPICGLGAELLLLAPLLALRRRRRA
jgi:hypothetical protein